MWTCPTREPDHSLLRGGLHCHPLHSTKHINVQYIAGVGHNRSVPQLHKSTFPPVYRDHAVPNSVQDKAVVTIENSHWNLPCNRLIDCIAYTSLRIYFFFFLVGGVWGGWADSKKNQTKINGHFPLIKKLWSSQLGCGQFLALPSSSTATATCFICNGKSFLCGAAQFLVG